jgi:uncharacterized protein (DUF924 family)
MMTRSDMTTPTEILTFWREAGSDCWYKKDDAFDAEVRRRYLDLWQQGVAGELSSWETSDDGALALVIVLDQFPRNMFRGKPEAFSSDAKALAVAEHAVARGADARIDPILLEFLYMPFMHSEALVDQLRCVELFQNSPDNLKYAREHAEIIRRFGRFPHRNGMLGRATTPEEQAYLDAGGFSG